MSDRLCLQQGFGYTCERLKEHSGHHAGDNYVWTKDASFVFKRCCRVTDTGHRCILPESQHPEGCHIDIPLTYEEFRLTHKTKG